MEARIMDEERAKEETVETVDEDETSHETSDITKPEDKNEGIGLHGEQAENENKIQQVEAEEEVSAESSLTKVDAEVEGRGHPSSSSLGDERNIEDGYQSENESDGDSDVSHDRLRRKDEAGYEEDNEDEVESDVSSARRRIASEGYEEEDVEESEDITESEEEEMEEEEEESRDEEEQKKDYNEKEDSGEEEEDKKEGRKSPSFVPRRTEFWDHDDRFGDGSVEDSRRGGQGKKLWDRASNRWSHDMYREEEQGPKDPWELEESRREQEHFDNRRRMPRGRARFGDFMRSSKEDEPEETRDNQDRRETYRVRGDRGRRGMGPRRGGGRGDRRSREHREPHDSEDELFDRSERDPGGNQRTAEYAKGDELHSVRQRPPRNRRTEEPSHEQGSYIKTRNDEFSSERSLRRQPQRDRREEIRIDQWPKLSRGPYKDEDKKSTARDDKGKALRSTRSDEKHGERHNAKHNDHHTGDEEDQDFDWGVKIQESKHFGEINDKRGQKRDVRTPQQRSLTKNAGEDHNSKRNEEAGQQVERKSKRETNEPRGVRTTSSPQLRGRGRGVMSENRTRGSKTAEDFRKERPVRRAQAAKKPGEEARRYRRESSNEEMEEEENGEGEDYYEDNDKRHRSQASKPATKPKRYSSQRQKSSGKPEHSEIKTEEGGTQDEVPQGFPFNPQLLSYLEQQQQQMLQSQREASSDSGLRGITPATVQLLQQHILQMQQQMQQLQMQNVVLRRQQLEQEQQHHQQQHHQQLFNAGMPQLGPMGQQNANIHGPSYRGTPTMGNIGLAAAGLPPPGMLYGMMQGLPHLSRPPPPHQQQMQEGPVVYASENTQAQQLVMNQQMTPEMYGPVQGGLFVPPPHMQQQQPIQQQQGQTDETVEGNPPRKPRSAAIPIKPPPEIAR